MESYLCGPNVLVLLVGEGNFSFSRDFLEMNKNTDFPASNLYSTCYESNTEEFSAVKLENIEAIKTAGVNVLFGVDATQLSNDTRLNKIQFTKFIFNFPHTGGKMKINLNRTLLQQFCEQCKQMIVGTDKDFMQLSSSKREYYKYCEVIIPLCKGQGGTCFDEARNWEDTWKIVEVAAFADLVLSNVEYFDTEKLKHYFSIGFRSREQHFNTVRGIIHILKLSLHPELNQYDTWTDMWPSNHIGQVMDMKQTSLLTDSVFNGFKNLFLQAVECYKDDGGNKIECHKDPDSVLELESKFIMREGYRCPKPQHECDPSKIYDYRIFADPLQARNFKEHPVEYSYMSYNSAFKSFCLSFIEDICDKVNKCDRVPGTRLPLVETVPDVEESGGKACDKKTDVKRFTVEEQSGDIVIRNSLNNETEVVFQVHRIVNNDTQPSKNGKTDLENDANDPDGSLKTSKELPDSPEDYALRETNSQADANPAEDSVKKAKYSKEIDSKDTESVSKVKFIFHLQKLAQFLCGSKDWRLIFSHENHISVHNGILRFHFAQLSPVEYKFDINFTVQSPDYRHEDFFACLWYIVPEMIQDVQLINEHQNPAQAFKSYLYRFWYKSYDRPMHRKKVIEIHQNVIGKYLHSMLGVKVD